LALSLLAACYCILTSETFPTLRHAEESILVYRSVGMMMVFLVPTFMPTVAIRFLTTVRFRILLLVIVVSGAVLCFLAIMAQPAFLYSNLLACIIGVFTALVLCLWITALEGIRTRALLFYTPYILLLSIGVMLTLLLLPQPYHEYAVFVAIICSIISGALLLSKANGGATPIAGGSDQSRPAEWRVLLSVLLVASGIGLTTEVIRLLAFGGLYEAPDVLYMTFCVVTFLAFLTALLLALYQLKHLNSFVHASILVAAIVILSTLVSSFTWIGHRGFFVFMGSITIFLASFLLPLLFAQRRSLLVVQVIGITQLGLTAGTLLGYLGRELLVTSALALEIQVLALSLSLVLFCLVLLITIFGVRSRPGQAHETQAVREAEPKKTPRASSRDFKNHLAHRGLTARQAEVGALVAKGYSVPAVAEELVVSKKTAGNHLTNVYKALNIHSKQELVEYYQAFMKSQ
jgi:DNA-binding CsgD family transcriptional regulator